MALDKIKSLLSQDKRKSDRLNLSLRIFYKARPSSKWIGPLIAEDIGADGLKFTSGTRLKKDIEITVRIKLSRELEPISVKGRVAWCKETSDKPLRYNIGVFFSKMSYQERKKFVRYIGENILAKYFGHKETEP